MPSRPWSRLVSWTATPFVGVAHDLVKEAGDLRSSSGFFPFTLEARAALVNPQEQLSPEQRKMLAAALRAYWIRWSRRQPSRAERRSQGQAATGQLMQLCAGCYPAESQPEELEQAGRSAGLPMASHPAQQAWMARRMLQTMGWQQLKELLEQLWQELARAA